ncbi:hypothetical protein HH310_29950 [Actinoplanes sp. TBRC 11911]|uniref:AfsR/SARP family transcriptional regulator n=1 Tax=Actinoplanes sp. TBRC 11911 TaxID=2729386 RepID=UPI00145C9E95|nr:AfsR/SARP family transcriptional regulator [Actinoplanes sp. TBRC 11911]NMO55394.1 hypothetical protein [Actinoplanes sp. TBRC 11911]
MGNVLTFGVLGPVEAWQGQKMAVRLGSPQQRAVLAALLLHEGAQATVEELAYVVWGDRPPASAVKTVRTHVSRLRAALVADPQAVETVANGYSMPVSSQNLDMLRFRELATHLPIGMNDERHLARLNEALALFRGEPLAGVDGIWADTQRSRLKYQRAAVMEERFGLELQLGRHREILAEFPTVIAVYPFRERLHEFYMVALYRSGLRAEAFEAYRELQRDLRQELGVEPGPEVQELHTKMLRGDPTLLPSGAVTNTVAVRAAPSPYTNRGPRQLPSDVPDFVGRSSLVADLTERLTRPHGVPLVGLEGLAGVGKTALAVHVAAKLSDAFPDGQLFVDLGGSTANPADPHAVLGSFLRAFTAADAAMPHRIADRAAQWRDVLAARRVLIVLDDARDGEQIRHLLPGGAGSAAIITSFTRHWHPAGTEWFTIPQLSDDESWTMLAKTVGVARLRNEPGEAREIIEMTCGNPMMIRIVANRLAIHPHLPLDAAKQQIINELNSSSAEQDDCIEAEERARRPYRRLIPSHARVFRLLAWLDAGDITPASAADLLGITAHEAAAALLAIHRLHLARSNGPNRFQFPALVRGLAYRLSVEMDSSEDRQKILLRKSASAVAPEWPSNG